MAPISVTLEQREPAAGVVALLGENDAYSAGRLENELAVLIESGLQVVVDLTEATFVDSQTLSALLMARHRAESARLGFTLALSDKVYTQVHRILDLTRLRSAFAVYPTQSQALAAARAGRAAGERPKAA